MGSTKVEAPPPRDYGKETRDALEAQVELAPQLFANEMKYRPQYADLERQMQLDQLGIDSSKGLLQAMIEDIVPAQALMKEQSTAGEIETIRKLAPSLIEDQRSADPEAEKLRQAIMGRAQSGLEATSEFDTILEQAKEDYLAGEGLTSQEERELEQQVLEGASARGMSGQASTLEDMISSRLSANREIGRQRSQDYSRAISNMIEAEQVALRNAGGAYQMGNFDVLKALTGRSGNSPVMAQQGFGSANFALNSSPALFNPESSMAQAIGAGNYQAEMDARTATASNKASLMSGMLGLGGSVLGGMATGGTGFFKPKGP